MYKYIGFIAMDFIEGNNYSTEIDDTDRASREITRIFDSYIESI